MDEDIVLFRISRLYRNVFLSSTDFAILKYFGIYIQINKKENDSFRMAYRWYYTTINDVELRTFSYLLPRYNFDGRSDGLWRMVGSSSRIEP